MGTWPEYHAMIARVAAEAAAAQAAQIVVTTPTPEPTPAGEELLYGPEVGGGAIGTPETAEEEAARQARISAFMATAPSGPEMWGLTEAEWAAGPPKGMQTPWAPEVETAWRAERPSPPAQLISAPGGILSDIWKEMATLGQAPTKTFNTRELRREARETYEEQRQLEILERERELEAGEARAGEEAGAIYDAAALQAAVGRMVGVPAYAGMARSSWAEAVSQVEDDKRAGKSAWLAEQAGVYDEALADAQAQEMILTESKEEFLASASTFYDQSPIVMQDPETGEAITKKEYLAGTAAAYREAPGGLDITKEEFISSAMVDYEAWAAGVRGTPVLSETKPEFVERYTKETFAAQPSGWDIASYFVPIYGTTKLARERGMTSGWTIGSAAADIAMLLPVFGWGAKATQVGVATGIRGLAVVPRTAIAARSVGFLGRELAGGLVRAPFQAVRHPLQFGRSWMGMTTYPFLHPLATGKAYGRLYTGQIRFGPPRGIGVEKTALMRAAEAGVGGEVIAPEWQMTEVPRPIAGNGYQLPWPGERFVPHRLIGPEEALFGGPRGWMRSQVFAGGAYQSTPRELFSFKRIPTEPEWFPGASAGRGRIIAPTQPWGGAGTAVRPTTATMTPEMVASELAARGMLPSVVGAFRPGVMVIPDLETTTVTPIGPDIGPMAPFGPGTLPISPAVPSPVFVPTPIPDLGLVPPPVPVPILDPWPVPPPTPEPFDFVPIPIPLATVLPPAPVIPGPFLMEPLPPGPPRKPPPIPVLPWLPGWPRLRGARVRKKKAGKVRYGKVMWPFGELFISMPDPLTLERKKIKIRKKGKLPYGGRISTTKMLIKKGIRL